MSVWALDENHDLYTSTGRTVRLSGVDAVVQRCTTRLLHYLGEWFLRLDTGTPWFQSIFVTTRGTGTVEGILKGILLDTEGVTSLTEFKTTLAADRNFSVAFVADTDFGSTGEVVVSG